MRIPDYDDEYLIFGLIFYVSNQLQVVLDKFYDEISAKQWFVLVMLQLFGENHPTMMELAEVVGSSHQNVKQLILKLEQKGYVELYPDTKDKRKCRVRTTDKCSELTQKYETMQNESMRVLFKDIEPEILKNAVKALIKLEENLEVLK